MTKSALEMAREMCSSPENVAFRGVPMLRAAFAEVDRAEAEAATLRRDGEAMAQFCVDADARANAAAELAAAESLAASRLRLKVSELEAETAALKGRNDQLAVVANTANAEPFGEEEPDPPTPPAPKKKRKS
jgi:hypothetical protein